MPKGKKKSFQELNSNQQRYDFKRCIKRLLFHSPKALYFSIPETLKIVKELTKEYSTKDKVWRTKNAAITF